MFDWIKKLFRREKTETELMSEAMRAKPRTNTVQTPPPTYAKPLPPPRVVTQPRAPAAVKPAAPRISTSPVSARSADRHTPVDDLSPMSPMHHSVWDERPAEETRRTLGGILSGSSVNTDPCPPAEDPNRTNNSSYSHCTPSGRSHSYDSGDSGSSSSSYDSGGSSSSYDSGGSSDSGSSGSFD